MSTLVKLSHFGLILYAGWYYYTMWEANENRKLELNDQMAIQRSSIKENQKKLEKIKAFKDKLEEAKERVEKVAQEVEALQRKLPETISDTENNQLFINISRDIKLRDTKLSPGPEATVDFYVSKKYNVKASGTFIQILIFFEKIGELERIFNISTVKITRASGRRGRFQVIDCEFEIEAYRFNPMFKENRGIDDLVTAEESDQDNGGTEKGKGKRRKKE